MLIGAPDAMSTAVPSARVPLSASAPLAAPSGCTVSFEIVESGLPPSVKTVPESVEPRTVSPAPAPISSSFSSEL